ncbi:MAG: sigma-70 family RNA polymerase sigma factor [Phycisphaeraceae bacterium]|nr:sigma-70 family RNA polymerase sigma factor [Phycisphaeraceae bacterium]
MLTLCPPTASAPQEPATPPHANPRSRSVLAADLPDLTRRQMKFRTERLGRLYTLTTDQVADLWQDLATEIVRALRRFDPAIASRTTFMKGVMNIWYRQKCKQLRREAETLGRVVSLPPLGTEGFDYADSRERGISDVDTRLDLADRIADLPEDLFALVRDLLAGKSVPEIAAERGVHRGTVNRLVLQLRVHLADLDPSAN